MVFMLILTLFLILSLEKKEAVIFPIGRQEEPANYSVPTLRVASAQVFRSW